MVTTHRLLCLRQHVTTNARNIMLTKPKSAIWSIFDPNVTLTFNLLTQKFEVFITALNFISGESSVKFHQQIRKLILLTTFVRDSCTHALTHRHTNTLENNASSHYIGRWQRHKKWSSNTDGQRKRAKDREANRKRHKQREGEIDRQRRLPQNRDKLSEWVSEWVSE